MPRQIEKTYQWRVYKKIQVQIQLAQNPKSYSFKNHVNNDGVSLTSDTC